MRLSKVICLALLASMPFAAFAARSSSVALDGGSALPGQTVTINGDKLYENVFYNVRCVLRMKSNSGETSSHIQIKQRNGSAQINVNYYPVGENGQSIITPNTDNDLYITGFKDYGSLEVRNLDRDNTLTVSDCIATPRE
mgnify:CR=1 FL=1